MDGWNWNTNKWELTFHTQMTAAMRASLRTRGELNSIHSTMSFGFAEIEINYKTNYFIWCDVRMPYIFVNQTSASVSNQSYAAQVIDMLPVLVRSLRWKICKPGNTNKASSNRSGFRPYNGGNISQWPPHLTCDRCGYQRFHLEAIRFASTTLSVKKYVNGMPLHTRQPSTVVATPHSGHGGSCILDRANVKPT